VLDSSSSIMLPGLVDTHVHLWQAPVRGAASVCWGRESFGIVHPLSDRLRPTDLYAADRVGFLHALTPSRRDTLACGSQRL
jgi:5-methylthioadenosine/S-adenosylhomocysteine deaminase